MIALWRRRRLILSLALCLVTVLFATVVVRTWSSTIGRGVTPTPSPSPVTHATYLFQLDGFPPSPLHLGQRITVRWVPKLVDPASSDPDAGVFCWLGFYGPAASEADATNLMNSLAQLDPTEPVGWPTPALVPEPRTISNRNPEPVSVLLPLPTTLRPGFYVAAYQARNTWDLTSDGGYFILRLVA